MESRICEHCGQDFISETFWDGAVFVIVTIIFASLAGDFILAGGWAWLAAIFCIGCVFSGIGLKLEDMKKKRGRKVSSNRKCPCCGEKSVDPDSPLGRQLTSKWAEEEQRSREGILRLAGLHDAIDDK